MKLSVNCFAKHMPVILAMVAFYLAGCTPAIHNKVDTPPLSVGAWITYWDYTRGSSVIERNPHVFDEVFFFSWALDDTGNPVLINKNINEIHNTIALLKRRQKRSWLTIVNDVHYGAGNSVLKDSEIVHQLLMDDEKRSLHRAKLLQLAQSHGFDGIDIDYENLHPKLRESFNRFIRELASDLKRHNLKLSITVQPKRGETRSPGPGAMDWRRLCRYVDRFQIMLYNLHNKHTGPGSMASSEWIREVMDYAQTKCDREKIVPVLKVSGMQWGPVKTTGIQHRKANLLRRQHYAVLQRQAFSEGGAPYFIYNDEQGVHTVYYEDAKSLLEKVQLLRTLGFGKIVLWSLGQHDMQVHDGLLKIMIERHEGNPVTLPDNM